MEQVEGGDLVVNKGHESKPREKTKEKNLNAVEGLETAFRLAEVRSFVSNDIDESNPKASGKRRGTHQVESKDRAEEAV